MSFIYHCMENKNANVVRILNNAIIIQTIKQKLN